MKTVNFENYSMNLEFDGEVTQLGKGVNNLLFEFNNSDILLNAYLQKKLPQYSFEEMIQKQIEIMKSSDYSNSKNQVIKAKLGKMSNVKVSKLMRIKTKFKNAGIILIEKNDYRQLQFHVDIDNKILILGLIMLEDNLSLDNPKTQKVIKKIVNYNLF